MRCCVPSCENASGNLCKPKRDSITFHEFPKEMHHRSAWVRSLGQQDSQLPDSAVVCSQHFLHDDICETESGSRELRTDAVPTTVLVCMICFDTDSKMFLTSQYNLREAYEKLTGYPLCDGGNLKQTLCVQCAQSLRNFSRFRDKSLKARSLMMKLLEKNKLVTKDHIKMVQRENTQLKNNLASTMLGPDCCDLYIFENTYDGSIPKTEETTDVIAVKTEFNSDSEIPSEDEATEMSNQDYNDIDLSCAEVFEDPLKYESSPYMCSVCCEEFPDEHAYSAHACMYLHGDVHRATPSAHTVVAPLSSRLVATKAKKHATEEGDTKERTLFEIGIDFNYHTPTIYEVPTMDNKATLVSEIVQCETNRSNKVSASKSGLRKKTRKDKHKKTQTKMKNRFACKICQYKCKYKCHLTAHMRTHSGEKPFSCKLCECACVSKSHLTRHMRSHIGDKPFSCQLCEYKCVRQDYLSYHIRRAHTGEKPFSCTLCEYKCVTSGALRRHVRTHTGEKPYSCELCDYKCAEKSKLVKHNRTHTGEKPYSCTLCEYKCATGFHLDRHMKTHTGERPFSCDLCEYKFVEKSKLAKHMRIHTGDMPYSCQLCEYKCLTSNHLARHVRTHTGEKPFSCNLCECKFAEKSKLVKHMRGHAVEMA